MKRLFLLLLPGVVFGDVVSLSCTPPTQNEDGSPLTDLAEIHVYWGDTSGGPYPNTEPMGVDCAHDIDLPPGTYFFVATAENSAGVESVYSNEATRIVEAPGPNPPTNLVAAGSLIAYTPSMTADRFVLIPVGTVPAGTPCDGNQSANGKYLIPRDSIQWQIAGRPAVVFTDCSPG